jgi:ubiquitin thioesterase OTU1
MLTTAASSIQSDSCWTRERVPPPSERVQGCLTAVVAARVQAAPSVYSEGFLGMPAADYCDWISKATSWGGGIELSIFSNYYEVEIASIDIQSMRMDIFGQGNMYNRRVYLLYNGVHYDAVAAKYTENASEESMVKVFCSKNDSIAAKAFSLAEMLHKVTSSVKKEPQLHQSV